MEWDHLIQQQKYGIISRNTYTPVHELLEGESPIVTSKIAKMVQAPSGNLNDGMRLYLTRDLDEAKQYLRDRYASNSEATYGMISSSRDKSLVKLGYTSNRFPMW